MLLSGYLLASPTRQEIKKDLLTSDVGERRQALNLHYAGNFQNLRQWESYQFVTDTPIAEEGQDELAGGPPYTYLVVCVRSGSKMILLAERKRVTDFVLSHVVDQRIFPNLRKVGIRVDRLIHSCESSDSEYLITTLYGRFSGSDRKISKISLFGDDLTDSSVFREHHHLFNFYTCGVGRRLFNNLPKLGLRDDGEIMLVGNDGFLSVRMTDADRAREAILLINYIVRNRWVDEWVPDVEIKIDGASKSK